MTSTAEWLHPDLKHNKEIQEDILTGESLTQIWLHSPGINSVVITLESEIMFSLLTGPAWTTAPHTASLLVGKCPTLACRPMEADTHLTGF